MKPFQLTSKAKSDLRQIATFTEKQWGRAQRNLYLKQIDDAFHLLADTPLAGKDCGYIKEGCRKFPQGSHVIFYKDGSTSKVEIIRILHKQMDVASKFINP